MKKTAVYALTPGGAELGRFLANRLDGDLFFPQSLVSEDNAIIFDSLSKMVKTIFNQYKNHVFITAAGIAVRAIAPCIRTKDTDPAVVVLDQKGKNCISLLSGHLGGANDLARRIASLTGGREVITTATDCEGLPSIDLIAQKKGMAIANIGAVKHINGAMLAKKPIQVFDRKDRLGLDNNAGMMIDLIHVKDEHEWISGMPGVYVDFRTRTPRKAELLLHPECLVAGIGCNGGTRAEEITRLIEDTFENQKLCIKSLKAIATIDIKKDEEGLRKTAVRLNVPLIFFSAPELNGIDVPNPSDMPKKHVGVKSVCEAAAILGTKNGKLIIPKIKSKNATLAVAVEA